MIVKLNSMRGAIKDIAHGISLFPVWSKIAQREIALSVKRTILGPMWLIVHRLMFAVAFSVLGVILWGRQEGLDLDVLSGYLVFASMIGYLQTSNSALITTLNLAESGLPVSVRLLKSWVKEFFLSLLSLLILIALTLTNGVFNFSSVLYLIGLTILMSIWGLGLTFTLSPLALRFRDISQIVSLVSIFLMFFSPIFWTLNDIKNQDLAQSILKYNPVADFIFVFRGVVNFGVVENDFLMRAGIHSAILIFTGFVIFSLTRRRISYWS